MSQEHVYFGLAMVGLFVNFFVKSKWVLPLIIGMLGMAVIFTSEVDTWLMWPALILTIWQLVVCVIGLFSYVGALWED